MTQRFRLHLIGFIGLAFLTLISTSAFAQSGGGNRGGGGGGNRGGGGGAGGDPTAIYVRQLKLEGKTKNAFSKAFRDYGKNMQKWAADAQKFKKKNEKYVGKTDVDPKIVERALADKKELEQRRTTIRADYETALGKILTPQQIKQVAAIEKRVAEQRARRAANQGNRQRQRQ